MDKLAQTGQDGENEIFFLDIDSEKMQIERFRSMDEGINYILIILLNFAFCCTEESQYHYNLNNDRQTSGKRVRLVLFIQLKSFLGLFLFVRILFLYFVYKGLQFPLFYLRNDGLLVKRGEDELDENSQ